MTDDVKQIMQQWRRPEPSADLAERIVACAGVHPVATSRQKPYMRFALAASLVLAMVISYPAAENTSQTQPAPRPKIIAQKVVDTVNGMDILVDVAFDDEDQLAFMDTMDNL